MGHHHRANTPVHQPLKWPHVFTHILQAAPVNGQLVMGVRHYRPMSGKVFHGGLHPGLAHAASIGSGQFSYHVGVPMKRAITDNF